MCVGPPPNHPSQHRHKNTYGKRFVEEKSKSITVLLLANPQTMWNETSKTETSVLTTSEFELKKVKKAVEGSSSKKKQKKSKISIPARVVINTQTELDRDESNLCSAPSRCRTPLGGGAVLLSFWVGAPPQGNLSELLRQCYSIQLRNKCCPVPSLLPLPNEAGKQHHSNEGHMAPRQRKSESITTKKKPGGKVKQHHRGIGRQHHHPKGGGGESSITQRRRGEPPPTFGVMSLTFAMVKPLLVVALFSALLPWVVRLRGLAFVVPDHFGGSSCFSVFGILCLFAGVVWPWRCHWLWLLGWSPQEKRYEVTPIIKLNSCRLRPPPFWTALSFSSPLGGGVVSLSFGSILAFLSCTLGWWCFSVSTRKPE